MSAPIELTVQSCGCPSEPHTCIHYRRPSEVFTEAEYKADAGKVVAHAVETGTAVVARADGSTRVVISIPPAEYGEVVCIDCRRPIEDCDDAPGNLCHRCVVTAEPDSDLTQAAIGMLRVAERTVLLPWKLIRAVWRTVTGH